jgi:hypothetical protein
MEIETVITIKFKTSRETFESDEFQKIIEMIRSGEMKREFEKDNSKVKVKAACTYWTNYKQVTRGSAFSLNVLEKNK